MNFWIVANRPQFVVAVVYSRTAGGTIYTGTQVTFESGARMYLCDVELRTATLLCDAKFPEARYYVREAKVEAWMERSLYVLLDANGDIDGPKSVLFRIGLDDACALVDAVPPGARPPHEWGRQSYVFQDRRPPESERPALFVTARPNGSAVDILVSTTRDLEAKAMFRVPPLTAEVVPIAD